MAARRKPQGEPADTAYAQDVAEAKEIVAGHDQSHTRMMWRLGELAHRVETHYRKKTLANFAKDVGVTACRLERARSVYTAWKDISAAPPILLWSVMRELQANPDRAAIVQQKPNITTREARKLMKAHNNRSEEKGGPRAPSALSPDAWKLAEARDWFGKLIDRARQAEEDESVVAPRVDRAILRQAAEPGLLERLNQAAMSWLKLASFLEQLQEDALAGEEEDGKERAPRYWHDNEEVAVAVVKAKQEGREAAAALIGGEQHAPQ